MPFCFRFNEDWTLKTKFISSITQSEKCKSYFGTSGIQIMFCFFKFIYFLPMPGLQEATRHLSEKIQLSSSLRTDPSIVERKHSQVHVFISPPF